VGEAAVVIVLRVDRRVSAPRQALTFRAPKAIGKRKDGGDLTNNVHVLGIFAGQVVAVRRTDFEFALKVGLLQLLAGRLPTALLGCGIRAVNAKAFATSTCGGGTVAAAVSNLTTVAVNGSTVGVLVNLVISGRELKIEHFEVREEAKMEPSRVECNSKLEGVCRKDAKKERFGFDVKVRLQ